MTSHHTLFKRIVWCLTIWAVASLGGLQEATAQEAILRTSVLSVGSGTSASSAYTLHSTVGQASHGRLANSRYEAYLGFWHQAHPPVRPVARPTATDDTAITEEDIALPLDVLANDTDPGSSTLSITNIDQPTHGRVEQTSTDTLTYTPEANYYGEDSFTYTIANSQGGSATARVNLTIRPVNDAPAFTSTPVTGAAAGTTYTYTAKSIDIDGDALALTAATLPAWLNLTDHTNGTATLTGSPTNADTGSHAVILQASDGIVEKEQAFTVTVVSGIPGTPALVAPEDDAADVETSLPLTWTPMPGAISYDVQLSTIDDFTTTIREATGYNDTTLAVSGLLPNTTYFWRVRAVNSVGASPYASPFRFTTATNVALGEEDVLPSQFALLPNYPNPFNPTTTITYTLPVQAAVRLVVYDLYGREVRPLVQGTQAAGRYEVRFEAGSLASGSYFYRIEAGSFRQTRQLILMK